MKYVTQTLLTLLIKPIQNDLNRSKKTKWIMPLETHVIRVLLLQEASQEVVSSGSQRISSTLISIKVFKSRTHVRTKYFVHI